MNMRDIYVIGSLNADLVQKVARLPRAGETLLGEDLQTFPGGKGANQACAAGRLGGRVAMIGCVGGDGLGQLLLDSLRSAGVDSAGVAVVEGPTGAATIWVLPDGENAIVVSPGANASLSSSDAAARLGPLQSGDLLLCQLEIPIDTVEEAIRLARRQGARTMLDPAPVHPESRRLLPHVDILTPNETEALDLLGRDGPIGDGREVEAVAKQLRDLGAASVVLKLGRRGCLVATEEHAEWVAGCQVSAVDATAAGDTFNGALACGLAAGRDIVDAARWANAAAALSVTRPGAQSSIPTRSEVEAFLERPSAATLG